MHIVGCNQLKLDAVQAAGGIDLVNSHLSSVGNSLAVHGSTAGQGAGHADDVFGIICGVALLCAAAAGQQAQTQDKSKYKCNGLCEFHSLTSTKFGICYII